MTEEKKQTTEEKRGRRAKFVIRRVGASYMVEFRSSGGRVIMESAYTDSLAKAYSDIGYTKEHAIIATTEDQGGD